ncbi:MAG: hypothetical protein BWY61_01901 [Firmicutes bacterium ADurb.Bin354]|nr:MAG: hypothetical protein BWY61_01901 [Firmicutes bacterium ADurb.Bin354]
MTDLRPVITVASVIHDDDLILGIIGLFKYALYAGAKHQRIVL